MKGSWGTGRDKVHQPHRSRRRNRALDLEICAQPGQDVRMRRLLYAATFCLTMGVAFGASAQIYKYKKADGTVVYTDDMGELPSERRAHYGKLQRAAKQRQKARENQYGKAELARRAKAAERKRIMEAQIEAGERAKRLAALDDSLKRVRKRSAKTASNRAAWTLRLKTAKDTLEKALTDFRRTQADYNALAIQPSFALLPGQGQKKEALRARLGGLEAKVDAAVEALYVTLPEEARRAGVPPGWLR